jgi:hypothetical protein
MEQDEKTHILFFKLLSKRKLNELLLRSDPKYHSLQDEINARLNGLTSLKAFTNISDDGDYKCSLYINFYDMNMIPEPKKIGHITFHFSPSMSSKGKNRNKLSVSIGRMHGKNNINKSRQFTLRINETQNSIRMTISKYALPVRSELKPCIEKSIEILNEYFNSNSPYFLGNRLFTQDVHPCYSYIVNQMRKSKTPIENTRKKR